MVSENRQRQRVQEEGGFTGGWPQAKAEGWLSSLKSSLFMTAPLDVLDICVNIPSLLLAAAGGCLLCFQRRDSLDGTTDAPRCRRMRPRVAEMGTAECPEVVELMGVNKNNQVFN